MPAPNNNHRIVTRSESAWLEEQDEDGLRRGIYFIDGMPAGGYSCYPGQAIDAHLFHITKESFAIISDNLIEFNARNITLDDAKSLVVIAAWAIQKA